MRITLDCLPGNPNKIMQSDSAINDYILSSLVEDKRRVLDFNGSSVQVGGRGPGKRAYKTVISVRTI